MTALEIIKEKLLAIKAAGLVNTNGECGCDVDDLSPGSCMTEECKAAKLRPWRDDDGEWIGRDDCHEVNGVPMVYVEMEVPE